MNDSLPLGWAETDVGYICDVIGGGTPSTKKAEFWGGAIHWITSADIYGINDIRPRRSISSLGISASATNMVPTGSIIVVTRVGLGKVAIVKEPLCFSQDSQGLVFGGDQLYDMFLTYYLSEAVQRFRYEGRGTTISGVTKRQLRELPVLLPPLAEQRRIVAEIEKQFTRIDASVDALERAQANLKRYRASVLKTACEGRLVPTGAELALAEGSDYERADELLERILAERRARWESQAKRGRKYKEPVAPDMSDLPQLPEGWVWATLPQLGELNRGKSKHRPRNDPRLLGGPYPFVQTGDIRHSEGFVTHHSQTYTDFGLAQSRLWPAGTLCITIAANIAETGILSYPACFPDSVVGFVYDEDPVTTKFLEVFVRSARDTLERFAPATAQKNINLKVLSDLAVPLPPFAEQRRIVAEVERRLSVVQQAEEAVEAGLVRAERLRQSILKLAFSGKLVPQDPDDEPASVLLERIRSEREAAETAGKAKNKPRRRRLKTPSR